jgi:flagellar biogenesis protein FliO
MTLAADGIDRGYIALIYSGLLFVLLLVIAIVWLRNSD